MILIEIPLDIVTGRKYVLGKVNKQYYRCALFFIEFPSTTTFEQTCLRIHYPHLDTIKHIPVKKRQGWSAHGAEGYCNIPTDMALHIYHPRRCDREGWATCCWGEGGGDMRQLRQSTSDTWRWSLPKHKPLGPGQTAPNTNILVVPCLDKADSISWERVEAEGC